MAITVHEHRDDEHRMLVMLLKHFDWEAKECYQNVLLFPWESDMLVLSSSRYVSEIEVKCSLSDWRADLKKDKWQNSKLSTLFRQKVKQFWYATSSTVYEQFLEKPFDLPTGAGLLVYGHQGFNRFTEITKATSSPGSTPITEAERQRLLRSVYFRFNRQYIKGLPKPAVQSTTKAWGIK